MTRYRLMKSQHVEFISEIGKDLHEVEPLLEQPADKVALLIAWTLLDIADTLAVICDQRS